MTSHGETPEVSEVELPGVGLRVEFTTRGGRTLGVIQHRSGAVELFTIAVGDPDAVSETIMLDGDEANVLVDALGGSQVTRRLNRLEYDVAGLAIDWLPLEPGSQSAGQTLGATQMRTRTGVSVVAVLSGERTVPSPDPGYVFQEGDVAVVVGTHDGIALAREVLRSG